MRILTKTHTSFAMDNSVINDAIYSDLLDDSCK